MGVSLDSSITLTPVTLVNLSSLLRNESHVGFVAFDGVDDNVGIEVDPLSQ